MSVRTQNTSGSVTAILRVTPPGERPVSGKWTITNRSTQDAEGGPVHPAGRLKLWPICTGRSR